MLREFHLFILGHIQDAQISHPSLHVIPEVDVKGHIRYTQRRPHTAFHVLCQSLIVVDALYQLAGPIQS